MSIPFLLQDTVPKKPFNLGFSRQIYGGGNGSPLQCLAWRVPGTAEPGGLRLWGRTEWTRLK